MIPLFKVRMSEYSSSEVSKVLTSGFIGQGPKVEEFEDLLWKELKTEVRPITTNSCTSAIDLALELLNVGPGDEIISTPQTCFASQVGIIHRGAKIRWADIDPITGLMDYKSIFNLINSKTKAIVCVNWAGKLCDFENIKSYGFPVIEDAAHTWDTFDSNAEKKERGDYICYSFQAIKFLTTGDGGILICPKEQENDARLLRWYGLDRTKNESFRCTQNIKRAGFKYHMNDIAATIGICNIPEAKDSVEKQRLNSKKIIDKVKNDNFILPLWDDSSSFWLFSMHVLDNKKQKFMDYLKDKGISSSPVHFRNDLYDCTSIFKDKELPGVSSFHNTQVCIPNGWWLSDEEVQYIIDTLNSFN